MNAKDKKAAHGEVTFLKVLKGPTIIKFHENFSHGNSIFIVMEYCSNGNLDQLIQRRIQSRQKFTTDQIFFEVISAFGTVGLSTGITAQMPPFGQIILMALMFGGRLGLVVVATALAVRQTKVHFEYPKERPLIG